MDRTDLSDLFRERLRDVLDAQQTSRGEFLRRVDMDRSALSQFLSPSNTRLPRADTLRRIAQVGGVSVDWLLGLENAREGRQEVSSVVEIESEVLADGSTPLERWHREAQGSKLRYVPAHMPDLLHLAPGSDAPAGSDTAENVLGGVVTDDMDIEICMPQQTLQDLAARTGLWRGISVADCRRRLLYMAQVCEASYPRLRLHLYDGKAHFSAPFTVFGHQRVALYVGDAYLVVTERAQVRAFAAQFDRLVRASVIDAAKVHETLAQWAG